MDNEFALTYLSFGAGVQSSALLVMSVLGLRDCPRADVAVFADTGAEPAWVYDQVESMRQWARPYGLEVVTVQRGHLEKDCLEKHDPEGERQRIAAVPVWTWCEDRQEAAPMQRQCTRDYKIEVLHQYVRSRLGYKVRQRWRHKVRALVGISTDEARRISPPREWWERKAYPLIEAGMSAAGCRNLLTEYGLSIPKKSACYFCPYHDDSYWVDLKENHPEEWDRAVAFDGKIRDMTASGIEQPVFLHRSLQPLPLVELKPEDRSVAEGLFDRGFLKECQGICGV